MSMTPMPFHIVSDDGRTVVIVIAGVEYELRRLRWRERNRAVHGAVAVTAATVALAPMAFAEHVLAASLVAMRRGDERQPVTLEQCRELPVELGDMLLAATVHVNRRLPIASSESLVDDRRRAIEAHGTRYILSAWSWGMRNRILAQVTPDGDGSIDVAAFHELVLDTMCTAIGDAAPPAGWLDDLAADTGDALLDAALRLSGLDQGALDLVTSALRHGQPHDAIRLYHICKQFGWTPGQVREQLASDIDALWAVHLATAPPAPPLAVPPAAPIAGAWRHGETVILAVDD
jgi:hypothetical protein